MDLSANTLFSNRDSGISAYSANSTSSVFTLTATFTSHENALCFINDKSEAGKIISLGGEMIPKNQRDEDVKDLWQKIAIDKMNEAYQVYMGKLKNNTESDSACAMVKESLK